MRSVFYLAAGVGFLGSLQSAPDRAELRKLNQEQPRLTSEETTPRFSISARKS